MPLLSEIKVPLLSVNDTHLTVVSCPFEQGAAVHKGDTVLVFETSKTTYEVTAEVSGFIAYNSREGQDYAVNFIVASIYSDAAEIPDQAPESALQCLHKTC